MLYYVTGLSHGAFLITLTGGIWYHFTDPWISVCVPTGFLAALISIIVAETKV